MDAEKHIGESAELYAIGALEAGERAAVESHIAHCTQCLRRVGEAEETVLALEPAARGQVPTRGKLLPFERRGASMWWIVAAAAAAFVLGMIVPRASSQHDAATLAMIQSHFSHAQFVGSGPLAKVVYARDRSWYYVIVRGSYRYDVYGVVDGHAASLGALRPEGKASDLFTTARAAFDRLELRSRGALVEAAAIR
ncbi:MAG: hypothetical protein JOZ77_03680 [Candidatus Eremiobacteraeota bacterium]|nr:hypothetical protein [Candidatus Eremiobacteraeota bacterium]